MENSSKIFSTLIKTFHKQISGHKLKKRKIKKKNMKGFAIHNAPTDHGGIIPATQMRSSQMGNLFVCAGDGHFCPKCQCWSTVIKSHDHVLFDGKPVAYVNDLLSCGARIVSQQSHVVGDSGGLPSLVSSNTSNKVLDQVPYAYSDSFIVLEKQTGEVMGNVYFKILRENGVVKEGITDINGRISHVHNNDFAENIRIEILNDSFDLEGFLDEYF